MATTKLPFQGLFRTKSGAIRIRLQYKGVTYQLTLKGSSAIDSAWIKKAQQLVEQAKYKIDIGESPYDSEDVSRYKNKKQERKVSFMIDNYMKWLVQNTTYSITQKKSLGSIAVNLWKAKFGHMAISELTTEFLQDWFNQQHQWENTTKSNKRGPLIQAFTLLGYKPNPAKLVEFDKNYTASTRSRRQSLKEQERYSYDEVRSIISHLEGAAKVYYAIIFGGGLRPGGEVIALEWSHWDGEQLKVCQTISSRILQTRTKAGENTYRYVTLSEWAAKILNSYTETRFKNSFIFLNKNGDFHKDATWFNEQFRKTLAALDIPMRRSYSARHFRARELYANKLNINLSAAQMGHDVMTHTVEYARPDDKLIKPEAMSEYRKTYNPFFDENND